MRRVWQCIQSLLPGHRVSKPTPNSIGINDEESNKPTQIKARWINGVFVCAKVSVGLLFLNILFFSIAAGLASKNRQNSGFSDTLTVYQGSCTLTKRWNVALHLVINGLGTAILGASNYCMQSLVAPNRRDIDEYHNRGKALDIGSASIKNLFVVGRYRLTLWLILLVTATPFHLVYNTLIFESLARKDSNVIIAPNDLSASNVQSLKSPQLDQCFGLPPDRFKTDSPARINDSDSLRWDEFSSNIAEGRYDRVDLQQCHDLLVSLTDTGTKLLIALAEELSVNQEGDSDILLVSDPENDFQDDKIAGYRFSTSQLVLELSGSSGVEYGTYANFSLEECWSSQLEISRTTCSDAAKLLRWAREWTPDGSRPPSMERIHEYIKSNNMTGIASAGLSNTCTTPPGGETHTVSACLAIKSEEHCQLLYSPPICIVIALTTFVKVCVMFLAGRVGRGRIAPLLTIGDAVASFMEQPDPTTAGQCWMSRQDVLHGRWKPPNGGESTLGLPVGSRQRPTVRYNRLPRRKFWIESPGLIRWIVTTALCFACIGTGAYLFHKDLHEQAPNAWDSHQTSFSGLHEWWHRGFSDLVGSYLHLSPSHTALEYLIIANTPQLVVTVTYFWFNNVMTSMLASAEYSSYGDSKRPLRVTWPAKAKDNQQKSTYWLSVPYRYGIPLLVISTILQWLISQSIFYLELNTYNWRGQLTSQTREVLYNPLATLLALIVGCLMVSLLFGLSFRRFKSNMPMAGTSSVAISAACHPPREEDLSSAAYREVMWGETGASSPRVQLDAIDEDIVGHCSFVSLEVVRPVLDKPYA